MSGPPRTPTAVLAARGSRRAKQRTGEPQSSRPLGAPPSRLSVEEKEVWRSVLADLRDLKVGKKPDSRTLERYCIETCLWRRAREFIAKYGVSYPIKELRKNPDGSQSEVIKCFCQFPQVAEMHKRAQTLLRIEQEFGLTPASRARLNMEAAQATQLPTRRRGAK